MVVIKNKEEQVLVRMLRNWKCCGLLFKNMKWHSHCWKPCVYMYAMITLPSFEDTIGSTMLLTVTWPHNTKYTAPLFFTYMFHYWTGGSNQILRSIFPHTRGPHFLNLKSAIFFYSICITYTKTQKGDHCASGTDWRILYLSSQKDRYQVLE